MHKGRYAMPSTIHSHPFDSPRKLMTKVQQLLGEDPRSNPEIFRDTGVPLNWLNSFTSNKFKNPSVNRMEYLYEQLSGKDLIL